jgi:hypothetical protein
MSASIPLLPPAQAHPLPMDVTFLFLDESCDQASDTAWLTGVAVKAKER